MLINLVEYHWAEHLDDALLLLARTDVKTVPLAGGTHLLSQDDASIEAVVDLRDLGLSYINEDARGIHIGAMTTLQEMAESPLLKDFAAGVLARAAQASSPSRPVRNSATIGGTVGAGPSSQADLLTALVSLDAEVVIRSGSKTVVNLSGGTSEQPGLALSGVVFTGKQERRVAIPSYRVDRRANELIIEVLIPRLRNACGASLLRVGRTPTDVALLNAAVLVELENGLYRRVRLAFGGVNMEATRIYSIERQLEGQPANLPVNGQQLHSALEACMAEFRPPSDPLASSGYRRVCGMNLAYRALEEATSVASWRSVVSSREEN